MTISVFVAKTGLDLFLSGLTSARHVKIVPKNGIIMIEKGRRRGVVLWLVQFPTLREFPGLILLLRPFSTKLVGQLSWPDKAQSLFGNKLPHFLEGISQLYTNSVFFYAENILTKFMITRTVMLKIISKNLSVAE